MMVDERAPGVSSALRKRIAAALEAGERPSLQKKNLRLGSVVLQRSDGRDAPALQEVAIQMARRGLDTAGAFNTFLPSAYVRGHRTYAVDVAGLEHVIARRIRGENRVTKAGQRFHTTSYSRYIIHVPTFLVRRSTGARFREDHYDVTGEQIGLDVELNARGTPEEQLSQLNRAYDQWVASGAAAKALVLPSDYGPGVEMFVDTARRPTFDRQRANVRDGERTVDTILDRVVFGEPVFAEDMWMMHRIHEVSRRRNGECGLDVIVASSMQRQGHAHARQQMLTAEQAAQMLVTLAREMDPDSPLATHCVFREVPRTAEIAGVDEDLRLRAPNADRLEQFKAGMQAFLAKPRSVLEVQKAAENSTSGAASTP